MLALAGNPRNGPPDEVPSRCSQYTTLPGVPWKTLSIQEHVEKKGGKEEEMSAEHTQRNKKKSTGQVPELKIWPHWGRWELCHQISMETEFHSMWTVLWKYSTPPSSRHTVGALLVWNTWWKHRKEISPLNKKTIPEWLINKQKGCNNNSARSTEEAGGKQEASPLHGTFPGVRRGAEYGVPWRQSALIP